MSATRPIIASRFPMTWCGPGDPVKSGLSLRLHILCRLEVRLPRERGVSVRAERAANQPGRVILLSYFIFSKRA
jgi:hypothetical protein